MAENPWTWWPNPFSRIKGTYLFIFLLDLRTNFITMGLIFDMKMQVIVHSNWIWIWGDRSDHHFHFEAYNWIQGDPTYLVVENDRTLATYGINAVCTHLGCVVPFNTAENKFICPCHGSQYNNQGRVVRGPAPLVSSTKLSSQNHCCL